MSELEQQPDDPLLKAAIRRAIGRESAPQSLRARITSALDAESSQAPARPVAFQRSWRLYGFRAAAAVLVLGSALAYLAINHFGQKPPTAPDWFINAMVTYNDDPTQVSDPQIAPAGADINAIRDTLAAKLKHPVMGALPGEGWEFKGACVADVRGTPMAHLMFKRGEDTLSVYSISAERMYMGGSGDGAVYELTSKNHQIAGFVYKGAVHCVVEDSSTAQLSDAIHIRDKLRTALAMGQPLSGGMCGK